MIIWINLLVSKLLYLRCIDEINSNNTYNMEIKYATLSEYFDAVMEDAQKTSVQFPGMSIIHL